MRISYLSFCMSNSSRQVDHASKGTVSNFVPIERYFSKSVLWSRKMKPGSHDKHIFPLHMRHEIKYEFLGSRLEHA